MKRALSESWFWAYLKNMFEYNLKKTGWGIFFQKWYFLVCWGTLQMYWWKSMCQTFVSLSIYALLPCILFSLSHQVPPFLQNPDDVSFSRKLYYLYLALIPLGSPAFTLQSCYRFSLFVLMCLFSCWYPDEILGTGTKTEPLGSSL